MWQRPAWANDFRTSLDLLLDGEYAIVVGGILYDGATPRIVNNEEAVRIKGADRRMEAQDFPNDDKELTNIVTAIRPSVAPTFGADLGTGRKTTYRQLQMKHKGRRVSSRRPGQPRGIRPRAAEFPRIEIPRILEACDSSRTAQTSRV
jgi:hypothetical protein